MSYFGESLKELLVNREIDAKTLIVETNLPSEIVYDTLNNKKIPNISSILKMCKYFNCSIDFLLGRTNTETPMPKNEPLPFNVTFKNQLKICKTNINRVHVKTGIRTTNIYRWINGVNYPNTESLIKLADHFGCSVDYLVGIER